MNIRRLLRKLASPIALGEEAATPEQAQVAREVSPEQSLATELWSKADAFHKKKKWEKSIENLRKYLWLKPHDINAHMRSAYCHLELGHPSAAYESVRSVLHLDASHIAAYELFLDLANRLKTDSSIRRFVKLDFSHDIVAKPHRWLNASGLIISQGMSDVLDAFAQSELPKVEALGKVVLAMEQGRQRDVEELLSGLASIEDRAEVNVRALLGRGRFSEAVRVLAKMEAGDLPADSLRHAIRHADRQGKVNAALLLLKQYRRSLPNDGWAKSKQKRLESEVGRSEAGLERKRVLEKGYPWRLDSRSSLSQPRTHSRVLYLLHNSLPYSSAGYATRSHGIIRGLSSQGWHVSGVTRPGYPFDRPEAGVSRDAVVGTDTVDGIEYFRLSRRAESMPKSPFVPYQEAYTARLLSLARTARPEIIHAASNYWNGIAGVAAARALGIPSVYEVRGLWEVTRISREPEWFGSEEYRFMAAMEAEAAKGADLVFALTRALKAEMVSRGVPEGKIVLAPNGVDPERFLPRIPNDLLRKKLGLPDVPIVGYIGSILDYEGIDTLLSAAAILKSAGRRFAVLIVGDGSYLDDARLLVDRLDINDIVRFTGRVPHSEVEDYYSLIDIAPLPRHGLPVTEMVSPLKPFEAMAMGKALIGSDVDAIAEIIIPGTNGLLFRKDDSNHLAETIDQLLGDPKGAEELGASARQWVVENRSWSKVARIMGEAYVEHGLAQVPEPRGGEFS